MNALENTVRNGRWALMVSIALAATACGSQQRMDDGMGSPADRTGQSGMEQQQGGTAPAGGTVDERNVRDGADEGMTGRREVISRLEDLRDRVEEHKEELDARMLRTEDQSRLDRMREYRLELERQRARLTDELRNLELASPDTWETLRTSAANTADEVGEWFDRQSDRLERLGDGDDGGEE
jgi:hypothetical protein